VTRAHPLHTWHGVTRLREAWLQALVLALLATPAAAELVLPPGFTTQTYVTGQGFDPGGERGGAGIPSASTLGFDQTGALYLGKTGARFRGGEVEDLTPLYRIPAGGARLTPESESRFFYGPPLRNPQVAAVRPNGDLFVTTYDRDRRIGALYRIVDRRPVLFAGGTPAGGGEPLLRHPEGVAVDSADYVYVADRERGAIVRLDPGGTVVDSEYLSILRPRMLAFDEAGQLWIAGDGTAETPFQDGAGQVWRAGRDKSLTRMLEGPLPGGLALSPGGLAFVVQRRAAKVFAVTPDGRRIDVVGTSEGTFLRGLGFAPVTPETRRAGIAGDLFLIVVRRQIWSINEVVRVSGPFDEFIRRESQATPR
jgi:NHL repeat